MSQRSKAQSKYSKDAVHLLATLIRRARKEKGMTEQELADRTGVSRSLIKRIEKGDTSCGIGSVFEAATIVGVSLFDMDHSTIRAQLSQQEKFLSLLPKSIRKKEVTVNDDF